MDDHEATLRKLSIRDDAFIESMLACEQANEIASTLDGKQHALVRIAALIAVDAATPSYMASVQAGVTAGLKREEFVGALVALLPIVGVARVVSAAPKLGLALGYDVGEALEELAPADLWETRR